MNNILFLSVCLLAASTMASSYGRRPDDVNSLSTTEREKRLVTETETRSSFWSHTITRPDNYTEYKSSPPTNHMYVTLYGEVCSHIEHFYIVLNYNFDTHFSYRCCDVEETLDSSVYVQGKLIPIAKKCWDKNKSGRYPFHWNVCIWLEFARFNNIIDNRWR